MNYLRRIKWKTYVARILARFSKTCDKARTVGKHMLKWDNNTKVDVKEIG
jgi:hypothetical protein